MDRILTDAEKEIYIQNRNALHEQLSELQADLEDMTDDELIKCRSDMLTRDNRCLTAILETDEDNM